MELGPDPDFPYLNWDEWFTFPKPKPRSSLVVSGGNLSPGMLLSAYRQGCFPWYSEGEPLLWWNPNPRFVLFPTKLHIGDTLRKTLKKSPYVVTFDTAYEQVIRSCAGTKRPGQDGTWITEDVVQGYLELHRLGFSHSTEVWVEEKDQRQLVGGLFGELLGQLYFGESMFSHRSNASKVGFIQTVDLLTSRFAVQLIDCQVYTDYLSSFGAEEIPRPVFLESVSTLTEAWTENRGPWTLTISEKN
ncbi:MAG: leucyl/phenylalanyl-tRNA--protein transferase [Spirochaetales bacterium]|nr:leucyl/phenylalanyl-tRNA--protein transferase [Spirochaetales bacterium]